MALEKNRKEVEVVKAKEELAKAGKRAGKKAMEVYKSSAIFMVEKAQAVAIFHTLEEFYADHDQFSKEAFHESFKLGKDDCCIKVTNHHPGLDLFSLDKEEESIQELCPEHKEVVAPIIILKPSLVEAFIMSKPPPAKAMIVPSEATPAIADPKEKVKGLNL